MSRTFESRVEFFAFRLETGFGQILPNVRPAGPTDDDARERPGHEEAIPGAHGNCAPRLQMKRADARAGKRGELDGPELGAVDGTTRAVSGEDGGTAGFDDVLETQQTFSRAAGAGAANRFVSEELESPGDELAVETPADDDGCAGAAKVEGARQDALMPEAEDFGSRADAEGKRHSAGFSDGLEAPGAADNREQPPDEPRNHSQHNALPEGESGAGRSGHWVDSKAAAAVRSRLRPTNPSTPGS